MNRPKKLLFLGIVLVLLLAAAGSLFFVRHTQSSQLIRTTATNCYLSKDAQHEIGKDTCVEFYVNNAVKSKNGNIFLNEKEEYKNGFSVTIYANNVSNFPTSPIYYQYQTIDVAGVIKLYQGHPEIIVSDPTQIAVLKK